MKEEGCYTESRYKNCMQVSQERKLSKTYFLSLAAASTPSFSFSSILLSSTILYFLYMALL